METSLFSFLEKENSYLFNLAKEIEELIYKDSHSAVIKGRVFSEILSKIVAETEGLDELNSLTQIERIKALAADEIINSEIESAFHNIRMLGNKAAHEQIEEDLESAISIHRNMYKIACWYMESYIDWNFNAQQYKTPMPVVEQVQKPVEETNKLDQILQLLTSNGANINLNSIAGDEDKAEEEKGINEEIILDNTADSTLDNDEDTRNIEKKDSIETAEEQVEKIKDIELVEERAKSAGNNIELIEWNGSGYAKAKCLDCGNIFDWAQGHQIYTIHKNTGKTSKQCSCKHVRNNKEEKYNNVVSNGCLKDELSKLKESSKEAVESLNSFSPFKQYMHVTRQVQRELEDLIMQANEEDKEQLILVCGGVGDGKSHIISYFKNKYPDIIQNFELWNDATESLEPELTSMDTLDKVLDSFSDEKLGTSKQKFILAINLGTLNNFIDSQYGERYTKLKAFVEEKKILESAIMENSFDDSSSFQFINFSDYHLYTLNNGKVNSKYIKTLFNKITDDNQENDFYKSYKLNCGSCANCECCPIKLNYELIMQEQVQDSIVELLVECIIRNKIIISTRALLNFLYDILIARSTLDINSPMFKEKVRKLKNDDFINSLTPNIIFNHKELSFIFDSLNTLDPLNKRTDDIDDFVIKFNNSTTILEYFDNNINYPKEYLDKLRDINFGETEDKKIKAQLLKLFIRSFRLCGKGNIITLKDSIYDDYISNLYHWNKGDKSKLKNLYNEMKDGILKWNGESDNNHINIFLGKNQLKYTVSEEIEIKPDTRKLPVNKEEELNKFISNLLISFKTEKSEESHDIEIDFPLYELLQKVRSGYRPNKKDKNHYIKFIEFMNNIVQLGSQKEKLIFTEKNREVNKKYKLEYDRDFEEFKFVER